MPNIPAKTYGVAAIKAMTITPTANKPISNDPSP